MIGLRRLVASLLCLWLGAAPVAAQETASVAPQSDEIYIENIAPQPLTFGLSNDNAGWERFQLAPGEVAVYGGADDWYFLILTEGVELRYHLDMGASYRLYWNEDDQRWDMMTCREPACGRTSP